MRYELFKEVLSISSNDTCEQRQVRWIDKMMWWWSVGSFWVEVYYHVRSEKVWCNWRTWRLQCLDFFISDLHNVWNVLKQIVIKHEEDCDIW